MTPAEVITDNLIISFQSSHKHQAAAGLVNSLEGKIKRKGCELKAGGTWNGFMTHMQQETRVTHGPFTMMVIGVVVSRVPNANQDHLESPINEYGKNVYTDTGIRK